MESKTQGRFSEFLRSLLYAVVILLLSLCVVFQALLFVDHLQTKKRLATIEEKMNTFELTQKQLFTPSPKHKAATYTERDTDSTELFHMRSRRVTTLSFQNLEERVKVLEVR